MKIKFKKYWRKTS